jgi:imidazolonepropionase-like amidohydrolase
VRKATARTAAAWGLAAASAAALAAAPAAPAAGELVAVRAKRIVTAAGPDVEDGVVLIRDGRIEAVGKVEIPPLAQVIDAGEGWVCPGFVEAHSRSASTAPTSPSPSSRSSPCSTRSTRARPRWRTNSARA